MSIRVITEWEWEGSRCVNSFRLTAFSSPCAWKLLLHSWQRTTRLQLHSTPVPQSECLCRDSRSFFARDYSLCVAWWLILVLIFTLHKVHDFWMVLRRNCLGSTSQHRKDYVIKEQIRRHLCGSESGKCEDQRWVLLRDSSLTVDTFEIKALSGRLTGSRSFAKPAADGYIEELCPSDLKRCFCRAK